MIRKMKPTVIVIGAITLAVIIILIIALCFMAFDSSKSKDSPTPSEMVLETIKATEMAVNNEATEQSSVTEAITADDIVKSKGLTIDNKGNVYDKNGVSYKVVDGKIEIVHLGKLYEISVDKLKIVTPTSKPTEKPTQKPTEAPKKESEEQYYYDYDNNDYRENTESKEESNGSYSQAPAVKPQPATTAPQNSIRISYNSLTVNTGDMFSLSLLGASSGAVSWNVTNSNTIKILAYEHGGNGCTFKALKKGTSQIISTHDGSNYYCTITVN